MQAQASVSVQSEAGRKKRKPGRPRLPKGQAKGKIVRIRFTKAEAELLAEAARKSNQTVSEWIRRIALTAVGASDKAFSPEIGTTGPATTLRVRFVCLKSD